MASEKKKQFSLSILVRVFLVVLVLVSIGVFARSVMYVNELNTEAEELKETLAELRETRAELEEVLESAEAVNLLLDDYAVCKEALAGTEEGALLEEYTQLLERIKALLNSSKNRRYIEKIANEELDLYFADEEIYYNDYNPS